MRYRQSEQLNNTPLEVVENTPQTLVALAFEPRGGGLNRRGKWFEPVCGATNLNVRKEVFYAKH